jgi:hypothetical protein
MKALSLWQPWASAIAVGAKRYETRHWPAPAWLIGQRVAIHAATRRHCADRECMETILGESVESHALFEKHREHVYAALPFGAVVCTAVLKACHDTAGLQVSEIEERWGNYSAGRYAWELVDVVRLDPPAPYTGRQGIFGWEAPEPTDARLVPPGELNFNP